MLKQSIIIFLLILNRIQADELIRETKSGKVKGKLVTDSIITWYVIPYAEPPVGNLRFRAPEQAKNWTDVRDATYDAKKYCESQEDCLFKCYSSKKWI